MPVDYGAIARALDRVDSVARERVAAGRALSDLSQFGFGQLRDLSTFAEEGTSADPATIERHLDAERARIEALYPADSERDDAAPTSAWAALKQAIVQAYIEIAGVDGAAGYQRGISISDDFVAAIDALPDRLAKAGEGVGGVLGKVAEGLRRFLTGLLGNALGPLLPSGTTLLVMAAVLIAIGVVAYRNRHLLVRVLV
jgi:hypothetical protein